MRRLSLTVLPLLLAATAAAQSPPRDTAWDYRDLMIPVRDGIRLHTVILVPRRAAGPLPIIFQRTPYSIPRPSAAVDGPGPAYAELAADGYVFAFQMIRGMGGSGGDFVMNRPFASLRDSTAADEATDAWDTIEWLLHNVPGNNGKVGVIGVSYPGWLAEAVLIHPHPAVKAVSPQAPMTDTWMGDDFFHQGAFRMSYGFEYGWGMEADQVGLGPLVDAPDMWTWYLRYPTLHALAQTTGALRLPTWQRFVQHPAYDSVWQARAFQHIVRRLDVPTLTVGGWWDQEDLYGPTATFAALERLDSAHVSSLVMGPWSHGGWNGAGDALGNVRFGSATGDTFRLRIEAPWFRYWLKGVGDGHFPDAWAFDGGRHAWRTFERWPPTGATPRPLYLRAGGRLAFDPPTERAGADSYVSDPAHPVPYRPRPVEITYSPGSRWRRWLTEDQRFVEGRPDVLTYTSDTLTEDVTIAGSVTARLFASTTGSDADWVVKLIDVFPDTARTDVPTGGYELMVASDIMRGRYRRSFEHAEAIRPNAVLEYTVDLHPQLYTFRRGHRIMVQVQSTWFPLYDRNPQTFVPNIFEAPAAAYRAQTHRIHRSATQASRIELQVLPSP